ncbi:hypothetical protein F5887DRAFT_880046 [Amanita rubescens]|nr:hypothetical protein F5887DRAFT_880046 [Amanita rubescens]
MPTAVSNFTRIWEPNVHWKAKSQCGIWDIRGKGVDIWECVRDRKSPNAPPNTIFWRYVTRR